MPVKRVPLNLESKHRQYLDLLAETIRAEGATVYDPENKATLRLVAWDNGRVGIEVKHDDHPKYPTAYALPPLNEGDGAGDLTMGGLTTIRYLGEVG